MSGDRLDQAAEYRRQAQEIRTLVGKIWINGAREQLLEAAEHLEGLAKGEEGKAHAGSSQPKSLPEVQLR
jgi:hypothetical protein